jgi:hypothetical protein
MSEVFRGFFLRIFDSGGRGLLILVVSGQHEEFSEIISADPDSGSESVLSPLWRMKQHEGFPGIISADF